MGFGFGPFQFRNNNNVWPSISGSASALRVVFGFN